MKKPLVSFLAASVLITGLLLGFAQPVQAAAVVGTSTRAKLNSLYGCGSIQSPIARPTRESRTTPTSAPESSPHSAATSTPSQTSTADISQITPQMMYPADGQVLNYGVPHGYMFKVNPITGATGYHYQFIQNGAVVYDNASSLSSNGEFAFWPGQSGYSSLVEGSVTVKINAVAGDQSSAARTITITLGRADLYPTSITTPSLTGTIKAGDQVFFDSGIGNRGVVSTGVFNIKWFVDEAQVGYGSHSGVPANTTLMDGNSQYSWTAVAGTHIIKFMVDADNFVDESDETNNIVSITISVPTP